MYLKIKEFTGDKPILFGQTNYRAPFGVVIAEQDILADINAMKTIPEGMFVVEVGDKARFLPRAITKNAIATNSPTITLKSPCQTFKVGDVLYQVAGYAEVTFGGTVAQNDVITLKIGDANYSVTAGSSPTGATVAAAFVTDHATALLAKGATISQKGSTATLVIKATDALELGYAASSGAISVTVNTSTPGFLGDNILPLGTISSIAAVNTSGERVVTLAGNAAYTVPANCRIGVSVNKYLGIYPFKLDFTETPMSHLAPIAECDGVYEQNLPYIDSQLKRVFSDLRINKRFYKSI
jgi:hypothetical protein